jgi:hypothetical protein
VPNGRVRAALRFGAVSLDAINPGYEGLLGAGRLNAFSTVQYIRSGRAWCFTNRFAPADLP